MTTSEPTPAPATPQSAATTDRAPITYIVILVIAFGLAAILGAYLDWLWWPVTSGLVITLAALPICLIGGIVAALGHGLLRRVALIILGIGVGLLAGQNLGPSRAPLLYAEGSITVVLDGPAAASATGPATCQTVADGMEISVSGDPNMRLDTPGRPFLNVYFDQGDRWQSYRTRTRANGVALEITVTPAAVAEDGFPSTIGMGADATSTVEMDLNASGGVIRFADLVPLTGVDYTDEALDLSGTIEFTCDAPFSTG